MPHSNNIEGSNTSTMAHFRNAFFLLLLFGFLFIALRGAFPFPEDFSPFGYAAASLIAFYKLIRVKNARAFWIYLAIPLLALLGFLEEISFGVESGFLKPIYWERLDVEIYDLHNFIPFLLRQAGPQIGLRSWDLSLFSQFLLYDVGFLIGGIFLALAQRPKPGRKNDVQRNEMVIRVTFVNIFFLSVLSLFLLFRLPTDPSNVWFLSFSRVRTLTMAVLFSAGLITMLLSLRMMSSSSRQVTVDAVTRLIAREGLAKKVAPAIKGILLLGLLFQLVAPFNAHQERLVQLSRLTPVVMWVLGVAIFFMVFLRALRGEYRYDVIIESTKGTVSKFFQNYPSYIYVAISVFLVLFAQAIDKDMITLNGVLYPSLGGLENWSWWIEEIFEAVGGVFLVIAAFLVPTNSRE